MKRKYKYSGSDGNGGIYEATTKKEYSSMVEALEQEINKNVHSCLSIKAVCLSFKQEEIIVSSVESLDFTPLNLSALFKNVEVINCSMIGYDLAWNIRKEHRIIGELFYSITAKEWWFIKDNFPFSRMSYRISFPIANEFLFAEIFRTINVDLISKF